MTINRQAPEIREWFKGFCDLIFMASLAWEGKQANSNLGIV